MRHGTTWGALPGQGAGGPAERPADPPPALRHEQIALVDLLDRVLAGGVVIMGEVRLAIAGVDLVTVSLQALISSVSTALGGPGSEPGGGPLPDRGDW